MIGAANLTVGGNIQPFDWAKPNSEDAGVEPIGLFHARQIRREPGDPRLFNRVDSSIRVMMARVNAKPLGCLQVGVGFIGDGSCLEAEYCASMLDRRCGFIYAR